MRTLNIFRSFFMMCLLFLLVVPVLRGQTGPTRWITNGTAAYSTFTTELNYVGVLCGTDTLTTSSFIMEGFSKVYSITWYFTKQANKDTCRMNMKRKDTWWTDKWTVNKTIFTTDSTFTQGNTSDTVNNRPGGTALFLYGGTNNDTVYVYLKIILKNGDTGYLERSDQRSAVSDQQLAFRYQLSVLSDQLMLSEKYFIAENRREYIIPPAGIKFPLLL